MGSSSPATTTQSQWTNSQSDPWANAMPVINKAISGYSNIDPSVTAQQTQAGQNLWSAAGGAPNLTPQATSAITNLFQQNPGMLNAAYQTTQGALSPIMSASLNPWQTPGFSDAMNTLTQNITNQVKGQYAGSGRDPSGAGDFAKSLGQGLALGESPAIAAQYNSNVGNLMNATNALQGAGLSTAGGLTSGALSALQGAGMLPGMAIQPSQQQYQIANQLYQQPIQNLAPFLGAGAALGGLGGTTSGSGYSTGTQTPANNPMSNILGGISGIAGLIGAFSDKRLKENIKDVGRTHDKQKIYSYNFKGSNVPQIGLLADEVEKKHPEAVSTDPSGFKRVRYDRATRDAAKMGMLSRMAA